MKKNDFWNLLNLLEWKYEGDDEQVTKPVVRALARMDVEEIFTFNDIVKKLIADLEKEKAVRQAAGAAGTVPAEERRKILCVALVNGRKYYEDVRQGRVRLNPDLEFGSILSVAEKAWAVKNERTFAE